MKNELGNTHKYIHVGFIGRLEAEKGADILLQVIERVSQKIELRNRIIFHVIGAGSFQDEYLKLKKYGNIHMHIYGSLCHQETLDTMKKWDILCMPSRFLETFGLVALEALSQGVAICGPKKGGLRDFIAPDLEIHMEHPVDDIMRILAGAKEDTFYSKREVGEFGYTGWKGKLKEIVGSSKNILIIHDYLRIIGGAEVYTHFLEKELRKLGNKTTLYGFTGNTSRISRIFQGVISLVAFWRYFSLRNIIRKTKPEIIWMQSVSRYIGPWGVLAVYMSGIRTLLTHHDLGLVVARPSLLEYEQDLPHALTYRTFLTGTKNPIEYFLRTAKYVYSILLWKFLGRVQLHIVPSTFMKPIFEAISGKKTLVFPHTLMNEEESNEKNASKLRK
ncbi:glycosyltransferase [Candidatus Gracilibacteria bacterium]|nr:glycosyltransferase [Candidatus Gracilibacteria bacterium]